VAAMKRALVHDRASADVATDVAADVTPDGAASARGTIVLAGSPAASSAAAPGQVRVEVVVDGWRFEFDVEDAERAALRVRATRSHDVHAQRGRTDVRAIIPGRVVTVGVAPGDVVTAGQRLLIVEAMKMQNELRSPRDGTVERVLVGPGATVELGDILLSLA
jgi:Pyruvate carboxylase